MVAVVVRCVEGVYLLLLVCLVFFFNSFFFGCFFFGGKFFNFFVTALEASFESFRFSVGLGAPSSPRARKDKPPTKRQTHKLLGKKNTQKTKN